MRKLKIKKGDTVEVISGADKGKKGAVLFLDPKKLKVRVQGVRVQKKHDAKESQIIEKEGFIDYSNVKLSAKAAAAAKKPAKKSAAKK